MDIISATNARSDLYNLIKGVNASHEPVHIHNKNGQSAVLISEEDWKAIEETLYLNGIPGLAKSIIDAGKEKVEDCVPYDENEEW